MFSSRLPSEPKVSLFKSKEFNIIYAPSGPIGFLEISILYKISLLSSKNAKSLANSSSRKLPDKFNSVKDSLSRRESIKNLTNLYLNPLLDRSSFIKDLLNLIASDRASTYSKLR